MKVLLIHSHFGPPPATYGEHIAAGRLSVIRERDLSADDLVGAGGLITTNHLDQIGFMHYAEAIRSFLARGGRWFFNGHILRPFVEGLGNYVPLDRPKRADLVLTRLNSHPVFDGIDQSSLEENRGVAGFYGRGHNPLPEGGLAVNGIGPQMLPVDWEWSLPTGGRIFSHAGNDLGSMTGERGLVLADRIVEWAEAGAK